MSERAAPVAQSSVAGRGVLFYDPACPAPYDARALQETALGGTEATVTRIAEALDACVMQHNRRSAEGRFLPPGELPGIEHLVVLRDPRAVESIASRFPQARLYVWLHDLVRPGSKRGRRLAAAVPLLARRGATLICVSEFQRGQAQAVLARAGASERVRAITIYNPIDDAIAPDGSAVDRDKLVFFSSPNKGLAYTLDAFGAVRQAIPGMRLVIGSPGYRSLRSAGVSPEAASHAGIDWIGPQPHARILAEVRSALCVFYPNFVLPETFGLVLAEAKAVGTPVLTHDCGAAAEVLEDPQQTLPVTRGQSTYERLMRLCPGRFRPLLAARARRAGVFEPYVRRIESWRTDGRPRSGPDARFRLSAVAQRWRALFGG